MPDLSPEHSAPSNGSRRPFRFRNYQPLTELNDNKSETIEPSHPAANEYNTTQSIESQAKQFELEGQHPNSKPSVGSTLHLNQLQPHKSTWDLDRGIEAKLAKLDRRTERAITELIRERVLSIKSSDRTSELATTMITPL